MGGVGKSYLAAHLAITLRERFPDGVLWARLPDSRPDRELSLEERVLPILGTFVEAYGRDIRRYSDLESRGRIAREVLADKQALIVLDNVQSSQELDLLLPGTSSCSTLITTRFAKAVFGYTQVVHIQPLPPEESLALLAGLVGAQRVADEQRGAHQIAEFVGGLPLALRLIGSTLAESTFLTLAEYGELLLDEENRLPQLYDWQNATKSVRASFELSYHRLDQALSRLFAHLALFDGETFSVEAIAAVAQLNSIETKLQMGRLASVSLVKGVTADELAATPSAPTGPLRPALLERYRLHSLLKLFAREKLTADVDRARRQLADYYSDLVYQNRQTGYSVIELEWHHIAGVLRWLAAQRDWVQLHQVVSDLTFIHLGAVGFFDARGHWSEAHSWLMTLLGYVEVYQDRKQETILEFKAAAFAYRLAHYEQAKIHFDRATALAMTLPESDTMILIKAYVCDFMSQLLLQQDLPQAIEMSGRGVMLIQQIPNSALQPEEGYLAIRHATNLARSGNLAAAHQAIKEALPLLPAYPTAARVTGLMNLGNICDMQGDIHKAKVYWQEAQAAAAAIGDTRRLAGLQLNLAVQAGDQGDFAACITAMQSAIDDYKRIGDRSSWGYALSNLAYYRLQQVAEHGRYTPSSTIDETTLHPIRTLLTEAAAVAELLEDRELMSGVQVNLGRWYLHQRHFAAAEAHLAEALTTCQTMDLHGLRAEIFGLQAQSALEQMQLDVAQHSITQALQAADTQISPLEKARLYRLQGRILRTLGRNHEAEAAFAQSLRLLQGPHPADEQPATQQPRPIRYPYEYTRTLEERNHHHMRSS
jgi:tetratricopeptide (TPR) repeat protein